MVAGRDVRGRKGEGIRPRRGVARSDLGGGASWKRWYGSVRRVVVMGAFVLLMAVFLIELTQWLWPRDRFFPGQRLDGVSVGLMSGSEAAEALKAAHDEQKITLTDTTTGATLRVTQAAAGITWNYEQQAQLAAKHTWKQRLIPLSFIFSPDAESWRNDLPKAVSLSSTTAQMPMSNATLAVKGSAENAAVTVTPAVTGYSFTPTDLEASMNDTATAASAELSIVKPELTTAAATKVAKTVNGSVADGFTVTYGNATVSLKKSEILPLLSFADTDGEASTVEVTLDSDKVATLLAAKNVVEDAAANTDADADADTGMSLVQSVAHSSAQKQGVSVDDSVVLADVIDYESTADAIAKALTQGKSHAAITARETSDTRKQAQKRANLTADLATLFGDADYSITTISMKDSSVLVNIDAEKDFVSASTYKLYVAYSMLKAVEDGDATWDSALNGTTLKTCTTKMIVESDNDCPKAWLEEYTYTALTEQAHKIGASDTTNFEYLDMHTTAADLATVLTKLYKGTILSDDSRSTLLSLMKQQEYRSGIPSGIGSAGTVADKVGFLDGLLHDAGIVYSEKGDYVMVIMTDGSSWSTISQAAALIYDAI